MKKLIVIVGILTALSTGCATKSMLSKERAAGFQEADKKCLELQGKIQNFITMLQVDLAQKNERLRKFNQLNDDGSLRTKAEPATKAPAPAAVPTPEKKGWFGK